jgi:hypothetical protein
MPLQSNVNVTLRYGAESTFGVASSDAGRLLRRASSTIAPSKDSFTSNEVRSDQQVSDVRHGTRRAQGVLTGDLSLESYDDFFAAVMRSSWVAGVTASQATLLSVTASNSAGTFTFGGGSLLTAGFKVGDVFRFTLGVPAANLNRNFRITSLTGTVMGVFPKPTDMASQSSFTLGVRGRKLLMGTAMPSFTIEQNMPDLDITELFTGMRVGELALSLTPAGVATANFSFQGRDFEVRNLAQAPFFTSPVAETTTGVLSGVQGNVSFNGAVSSVVTQLDLSVNLNLSSQPVVGSQVVPDIFYGRSVVTGNISAFIEDISLLNAFINESEIDIVAQLDAAGADPKDFLTINMQRVKLTGLNKTIGPDGGVMASFPFQALLKPGGTGTAFDQSTVVFQRSNV